MTQPFNFKEQNKIGEAGEKAFFRNYPNFSKLGKTNANDFIDVYTGKIAEIKTDTYTLDSGNFFIEVFSNDDCKPGGPFRSFDSDYYVYYYINANKAFWFRPADIVYLLDELKAYDWPLVPIKNKGYTTWGLKVPRRLLKSILIKEESWNE